MRPTGDIGVYVHFPYCRRLCPYCDFKVDVVRNVPHRAYANAVLRELEARLTPDQAGRTLRSLYFGGGTPSLWESNEVGRIVNAVRNFFPNRHELIEITLEANPEQVDEPHVAEWLGAGINRLSIGIQSFDDPSLVFLGRDHSAAAAAEAVAAARHAGMPRLTFDLICALPGRDLQDWRNELAVVAALAPLDHASVYELTFHSQTAFGRRLAKGRITPAPEAIAVAVLEETEHFMAGQGLAHYEVSNYARPGCEAVHNSLYWHGGEYLGLGVGAHSMRVLTDAVERRENTRNTAQYLDNPLAGPGLLETLDAHAHFRERLFLGLRTIRGVDPAALEAQLGVALPTDAAAGIERCLEVGLLQREGVTLKPTSLGLRMADSIAEAVI